ncbi:MAG: DNA mismatch repair protein MutS [Suilimivivens sp.]
MKENYFYETPSAKMLEFDKVIEQLEVLANTKKAKEQIRGLCPSLSETEVKASLRTTTEARIMLEKCGTPPVTTLSEIPELIMIAEKGGCLTPEQLQKVAVNLTAVRRLKDYLNRGKAYDIGLPYYEENLDPLDEIREEISEKIRGERVDDYASKLLKSLREGIDRTESRMREKADAVIRMSKECMSDSFSTTRNGHICIPVKKEYKFRVSGSVIDKSSTGSTLFIEPTAVTKLYEELQEMKIDEENEERRILYTLTVLLSDKAEIIGRNNATIEKLDFLFAKGKLILCDIGDGQNLSENLSTFSAHITNVLSILKKADNESLVILDELGSGTDPAEGMGIAIAILQELKKSGALYLVTTHYPEVKTYAEKEEGVINARMTFDKESLAPLYQLVIGEAGESCAFYIAKKLGMPESMLQRAAVAAYGEKTTCGRKPEELTNILQNDKANDAKGELQKEKSAHIRKTKNVSSKNLSEKFRRGDSVMIYPDKKIGIVCETVNEKGILRVQLPDKKIYINHKRVKLHVAAEELYPEDYDFSIIFDSVETRKARHQMERKYVEGMVTIEKD